MIRNPFIEDSEVEFQSAISKEILINEYKTRFNIDINEILSSKDNIELYKCKKSSYKFFYPFDIAGDSKFYEKLQENDWYYMPWKWEHQVCKQFINEGNKILEVGCGKGDFLKNISDQFEDINCVGLELNESTVLSGEKYKIFNRNIEDYCLENEGQFDVVCSFQVLEHIPEVSSFLRANIKCLKENGLLVISVPNNDSFIKHGFNPLNMPPHHMGLWTEESLKMIGNYFNLELLKIEYEPLQEYHFDFYLNNMIFKNKLGKYAGKYILRIIERTRLRKFLRTYIKNRAKKIRGHTILIVFKKTAASK